MTDKLELKSCHEVVYAVDVADVDSIFYCKPTDPDILTVLMKDGKRLYCDEVCPIDSLQEEPVSEDLEEASKNYALNNTPWDDCKDEIQESFKAGAKWDKKQVMAKAIDAHCFGFQGAALFSFRLPADNYLVGSEVKIIVIKKD